MRSDGRINVMYCACVVIALLVHSTGSRGRLVSFVDGLSLPLNSTNKTARSRSACCTALFLTLTLTLAR